MLLLRCGMGLHFNTAACAQVRTRVEPANGPMKLSLLPFGAFGAFGAKSGREPAQLFAHAAPFLFGSQTKCVFLVLPRAGWPIVLDLCFALLCCAVLCCFASGSSLFSTLFCGGPRISNHTHTQAIRWKYHILVTL